MDTKAWWRSKTVWVNLIALTALGVQQISGSNLDLQTQAGLLAMVNIILRLVTASPIGLQDEKALPPEFPGVDAGPIILNKYPDLKADGPKAE